VKSSRSPCLAKRPGWQHRAIWRVGSRRLLGWWLHSTPPNAYDGAMLRWTRSLRAALARLAASGCNLLFPRRCVACETDLPEGTSDVLLCGECLTRLGPDVWHGCRRCAGQVPSSGLPPDRCPHCRDARLKFDAAVALGSYHAGLRDVVLRMKRPSSAALALAMGRLLAHRRRDQLAVHMADMVVPIPMYWARRLGRGMNSPEVLAGCLGKSL
jgi:predicted amidophosphoribosyltransferase